MTDERKGTGNAGAAEHWNPGSMLPAIWLKRSFLLTLAALAAALTLGINFLLPVYYRSSAKLLPDLERNRLGPLTQAAEVAQLVGVGTGTSDPARVYPAILTSETVLRGAVLSLYARPARGDTTDLIAVFAPDRETPEENIQEAILRLRDLLSVQVENRTGVVAVSLEMRDPDLAADVLNMIVAGLDRFMRQKRSSNATEQRKWIEDRLRVVQQELRSAEESLRAFREKNRRVLDSPGLLLEQERHLREVQVKSVVFTELVKQLELAKIEEIRNIAIVNVLDPARPPVQKDRPRRMLNTLLAFFATLAAGAIWVGAKGVSSPRDV